MSDERIISKLRKLIAHQESAEAIGSLAEAEAFSAKIQQLLIDHKLEAAQIGPMDDHDDEPVTEGAVGNYLDLRLKRRRIWWMEELAGLVARAHFCELLVAAGTSTVWFVGTASDRAITEYTYVSLCKAAIEICDREFKLARREGAETRAFRRSFFDGFTYGIGQTLRKLRREADATESTALVLQRSDAAVQKYLDDKFKGKRGSTIADIGQHSSGFNLGAYSRGKRAGESTSIQRGVGSPSRSQIGAGQ